MVSEQSLQISVVRQSRYNDVQGAIILFPEQGPEKSKSLHECCVELK